MTIGTNVIDMYTGHLSPKEIAENIPELLEENAQNEEKYKSFLAQEKNKYRLLTIKDNSQWILLPGKEQERYVQIHPGKHSPHTTRIKANTLKTVLGLFIEYAEKPDDLSLTTSAINKTKTPFQGLPPIKNADETECISRLFNQFNE